MSLVFLLQGARGFPGTPGLPGIKGHRVSLEEHWMAKSSTFISIIFNCCDVVMSWRLTWGCWLNLCTGIQRSGWSQGRCWTCWPQGMIAGFTVAHQSRNILVYRLQPFQYTCLIIPSVFVHRERAVPPVRTVFLALWYVFVSSQSICWHVHHEL